MPDPGAASDPGAAPDPPDDRRGGARPRRRRGSVAALAVLGILVVAGAALVASGLLDDALRTSTPSTTAPTTSSAAPPSTTVTTLEVEVEPQRPAGWPPPPTDTSPVPLGRPGPVPEGGGPHTFVAYQRDGVTPVGYDPCRPVRFVTRPGGPPEGPRLIREAVERISAATGLRFVDEGPTDEGPSESRRPYQPERYGERWAPVLITWSNPEESPQLARPATGGAHVDIAGHAGSTSVGLTTVDRRTGETTETGLVYVTGSVTLDEAVLTRVLAEPDGHARARAIILHELAHLVGLGHVDDPAQLMHPQARPEVTELGPGDLEGLARLGTLDCFPEI